MEKYLQYAPYITTIIAVLSILGGFLKYIDSRNREEKRLSYENFLQITDKIAKLSTPHGKISVLELILTIYQLQNLKNYSKTIIPILVYLKACPPNFDGKKSENYYNEAIDYVLNELNMSKLDRFFASLRMIKMDRLPRRRFAPPRNDNAATVVLNDK